MRNQEQIPMGHQACRKSDTVSAGFLPRGVMIAGAIIDGGRGGIDLPNADVGRVKSHLAKYYKKIDDSAPWERG